MKTSKFPHPVTRVSVLEICKQLNLRITQMQAIEAILHCRGKLMEASPEEDYSYDKLINFLQQKIQILPPFDTAKPCHPLQKRTKLPRLKGNLSPHAHRFSNNSPMDQSNLYLRSPESRMVNNKFDLMGKSDQRGRSYGGMLSAKNRRDSRTEYMFTS